MVRLPALLGAHLVLLLAAAGCGGGGGDGKRLTKAEYEARIAEIAKEIGDALGKATAGNAKNAKENVGEAQKAIRAFADDLVPRP